MTRLCDIAIIAMTVRRRRTRTRRAPARRRRIRKQCKGQKGGLFPLAALIPALVAAGKAAALGAVGGTAGYGAKRAIKAATR